jgi:hypothetical protein
MERQGGTEMERSEVLEFDVIAMEVEMLMERARAAVVMFTQTRRLMATIAEDMDRLVKDGERLELRVDEMRKPS